MILRKVWDGFMDPIIGTISDSEETPIGEGEREKYEQREREGERRIECVCEYIV